MAIRFLRIVGRQVSEKQHRVTRGIHPYFRALGTQSQLVQTKSLFAHIIDERVNLCQSMQIQHKNYFGGGHVSISFSFIYFHVCSADCEPTIHPQRVLEPLGTTLSFHAPVSFIPEKTRGAVDN